MIVICDNSALSALAEAGLIELLHSYFGNIVIPEAVRSEAVHPGAPVALRQWLSVTPNWLSIVADPHCNLDETTGLGPGEAAAITLAWQVREQSLLILDERRGRTVATSLGLRFTGTVAILGDSAKEGLVDFDDAISRLRRTGFHVADVVVEVVRNRLGLS